MLRLGLVLMALLVVAVGVAAEDRTLYVYASVGDNQWVSDWPPIDSRATVGALFEWLRQTHGASRMYWRGEQDRMCEEAHEFRRENPLYHDWWTSWIAHLSREVKTDDLAVQAARRQGMQIYVFTSLFDHGCQGDVGGCGSLPYASEDRLRLEHPEWCPVDRYGERRSPGPLELCYPQARQALVKRFISHVVKPGYDGISFYTYVENMGQRFMDEFGYNEPIVAEFKRRHGVDIRTEPFDREAWARLRGEYVTQFLGELHMALRAKGKKLSMVVRPDQPHLPQRWLSQKTEDLPSGPIYMDWEGWVKRGVVDELLIWVGGSNTALAQQMVEACRGTEVKVVVLSSQPFDASWQPFREQGVVPCSVAAPGYGIDPMSLQPTSEETLGHADWAVRAQTLVAVGDGKLKATPAQIVPLLSDPHVLVRREAIRTLAALKAAESVPMVEAMLRDRETSVRTAAATALGVINGSESAEKILAAMEQGEGFQYREAALKSLAAMKEAVVPALRAHRRSKLWAVREAIARVWATSEHADARGLLLTLAADPDYRVRFTAIGGVARFGDEEALAALLKALDDKTATVQLRAARALGERASALPPAVADQAFAKLCGLFDGYGDGSRRRDAAWGWRVVGMALQAFGDRGKTQLEHRRDQRHDQWLAWAAYLVLHVPQNPHVPVLCSEAEAAAAHDKYAPPFPGDRR